ncbi:MAG: PAQR family membrane homeostasis protein TrhA [Eubacteriaceae bacterium]
MKTFREPMNALTHLIGACLSIIGMIVLFLHLFFTNNLNFLTVVSALAFGIGLIALYSASFIYHRCLGDDKKILGLKKWDHAMIFILIAGSYTPFCLISLSGTVGIVMLSAIWGVALLGIVLKILWINMPRWLGTALYIFLGWFAIFVFIPLYYALPFPGFVLLLIGGIMYTVGGVIYAIKKPNLFNSFGFHELFHIFVMLGSLCHFCCVYFYVL